MINCHTTLTHWGQDKMIDISQMTFSNAFSWLKMHRFRLIIHCNLFLRVQLTLFQYWFRWWIGAVQATSYCLNQLWQVYWCIYESFGPNELKEKETQHSFAELLNIYISGIWLWYMQALFINRVKQNRCLKSENPQPMVVTILPPCSGKQLWMWCSVVSSLLDGS